MNILYRGIWTPPKYKFTCGRCGTIWECEENETQIVLGSIETYIACACPVCGENVMTIMEWENLRMRNTKVVDK